MNDNEWDCFAIIGLIFVMSIIAIVMICGIVFIAMILAGEI